MFNFKSIGFGIAVAVLLYFTFLTFGLGSMGILGFVLGALFGGYLLGGSLKDGATHGAIISFSGYIIALIIILVIANLYSVQTTPLTTRWLNLVLILVIYTFIGAVAGTLGSLIKNKVVK
ncbi:MAG: DUF5518 domain-containing protein [Methanobacteriaceae archaeon]|nr:DUF5518 domain-containing protein [Methanobacteriaceae archaeon]